MNGVVKTICFNGIKREIFIPFATEDNKTDFYGYTIYKNGEIYSPKNVKLSRISLSSTGSHVNITIAGMKLKWNVSRLIYVIFSGQQLTKYDVITYKDNNEHNKEFDNLYKVTKKEYYKGIKKTSKKKLSKEQVDEIRTKYMSGTKNQTLFNNKGDRVVPSYRSLASEYNCSTFVIQQIIKGEY